MPRFHFNSLTDDMFLPDPEGEELPNLAAANSVAEMSAREALIEAVRTGDAAPDCILVTDHRGREVATVFLRDLLDADVRYLSPTGHRSAPIRKGENPSRADTRGRFASLNAKATRPECLLLDETLQALYLPRDLRVDGFRVQLSWYGNPLWLRMSWIKISGILHVLFGCDVVSSATLFSFGVQGVLLGFVLLN